MPMTEAENEAYACIFANWGHLTAGQLSIIYPLFVEPGRTIMVKQGTAHHDLWINLQVLGWAEEKPNSITQFTEDMGLSLFQLTTAGFINLPHVILGHGLVWVRPQATQAADETLPEKPVARHLIGIGLDWSIRARHRFWLSWTLLMGFTAGRISFLF